jgi:hypothetical protein
MTTVKYNDISTVPDEYKPIIFTIKISDKKIYNATPELSQNYDYPLFSIGFQQFLHANVKRLDDATKDFEGRKKVYTVMNLFEPLIDNYDAGIDDVTNEYFHSVSDDKIIGKDFYKVWEIVNTFDLIPTKGETFSALNIADKDYAGSQAILLHRKLFSKKAKDKLYVVESSLNEKLTQKLENFKKNNKNIKTFSINKNMCDIKTINSITKETSETIDLVVAHTYSNTKSKFVQEQELTKLVIGEFLIALKSLNNGGNFICKMYETYTRTMCRLIYILSQCFENMYIIKPVTSRASSSEKFLVCKNYKPKQKIAEQFEKLVKILSDNEKLNIISIFPDLEFTDDFTEKMTKINTSISIKQVIGINKIIAFIKSQNYYGEDYSDGRIKQINANTYWTNLFLPNNGEYKTMISLLEKVTQNVVEK